MSYHLEQTYELENVGILNVPDSASVHNSFKLLKFPETRLFQCEDIKAKVFFSRKYDFLEYLPLKYYERLTNCAAQMDRVH